MVLHEICRLSNAVLAERLLFFNFCLLFPHKNAKKQLDNPTIKWKQIDTISKDQTRNKINSNHEWKKKDVKNWQNYYNV